MLVIGSDDMSVTHCVQLTASFKGFGIALMHLAQTFVAADCRLAWLQSAVLAACCCV